MGEFRTLGMWGTLVLGSAIVAACGDSPVVPPEERPLPTSCADPGGVVHEGVFTGANWKASDGPHHLHGAVTGQTLVIEAGALICGAPGAALGVGMLEAEGTADAPIVFTARDPSQPWAGIKPSTITVTTITLSHATVEHAIIGVQGTSSSEISISHSLIRQTQAQGILFGDGGTASLVGSVVDSACLSMCTDARGYAVVLQNLNGFHLEDNQILNSGGGGVLVLWRASGVLLGGSIEGSAGIGLFLQEDQGGGRSVRLTDAAPVRITGGSSYPASVPLQAAEMLLATREAQEGWLGNARDTVLVTAHASRADEITIHPGLVWLVAGGGPAPTNRAAVIGSLELMAGAVLSLRAPS
ncbi:MAG TPA: right-handed parallel beta-helix repeat-containing protein, partial [Vicinamibacterales bacterium]|nr:right-handed parallel beta-helix repeat-containing protein [Vicinamibacterales bacterium]